MSRRTVRRRQAARGLPAPRCLPRRGGTIEVHRGIDERLRPEALYYVTHEGHEHQLTPDPASAEGRRANLARQHPALSCVIGCFSAVALTTALVPIVSQVAEKLTEPPEVAQNVGTFHAPVHLSVWMNLTLVLVTLAASTERALRLRYSRLLDGGAG